ncbi:hypothetical protein DESC_810076 [Desulfosarcina cetonica]|nr:hypothetical protein DESC_810076 [Desulfosarcina cetonica]
MGGNPWPVTGSPGQDDNPVMFRSSPGKVRGIYQGATRNIPHRVTSSFSRPGCLWWSGSSF